MIAFLLNKKKNRENKKKFRIFSIKHISIIKKKFAKVYNYKVLKMFCQNVISKLSFIFIIDIYKFDD